MRSLTVFVRVAVVVACLAMSFAEPGEAQKQNKWLEFITGTNYNGGDWQGKDAIYFAEIRLRITHLSESDIGEVKRLATTGTEEALEDLKQLLRERLPDDSVHIKNAKQDLINALVFRRRALGPEEAMGIDWVNLGTGEDFSGEPRLRAAPDAVNFVEVHLRIPLTAESKKAVENFAAARDFKTVSGILEDALVEAGTANAATQALVRALKFKKEKRPKEGN